MKYIKIFLLLFVVSCTNHNVKSSDSKANSKVIDTVRFKYTGFNNGSHLDLLSDGRFINEDYFFGCMGGGERKKVFGTYVMDSLNLFLKPDMVEFTQYPFNRELKPKKTKVEYGSDSLKIKTVFQIVQWENKKYLLSETFDEYWSLDKENDYIRFADMLNHGFEPKMSGMYLVKGTKDSIMTEFDLKQIPEKWQKYFLKKPISVQIKNITKRADENDEEIVSWLIEFDKGKNHSVNNRLTLQTKDGYYSVKVDSVVLNRSFGVAYMYDFDPEKVPIGTELRTKW